jgi:hypothetical protein
MVVRMVQYLFCDFNISRHDNGGSPEGLLPLWVDAVEKVFFHGLTQILRAAGAAIL